jgi:hypothetical protein
VRTHAEYRVFIVYIIRSTLEWYSMCLIVLGTRLSALKGIKMVDIRTRMSRYIGK